MIRENEIKNRIYNLMAENQLTKAEFCEKAGVSYSTVIPVLGGKKIFKNIEIYDKIADAFGTTVDYILGRTDEEEQISGNEQEPETERVMNFEKYKEKILNCGNTRMQFGIKSGELFLCPQHKGGHECEGCLFHKENDQYCGKRRLDWLYEEYKEPIKISGFCKEYLTLLVNGGYRYIARDEHGDVIAFRGIPIKSGQFWRGDGSHTVDGMLKDCFPFIKNTNTGYNIKKILQRSVVDEE